MSGRRTKARAVMTVFFALLSTLFLGIFFVIVESVRYQGIRAHAQQIAEMGNYSVFGEFEKKLLADFEIFAVDGAYGTGDFSAHRVADRYREWMNLNAQPTATGLSSLGFDPWKISVAEADVEDYTLLSDGGGEAFYQQAVAYMRDTSVLQMTDKLLAWYRDAQNAEEKQKTYEAEKNSVDREMEELEKQEAEKKKELENAGEGEDQPQTEAAQAPDPTIENPIPALNRLRRKDILTITCGGAAISEAVAKKAQLPSRRRLQKGTLAVKKKYGGLIENLLFREYLLDKFGCYRAQKEEGTLKYELEYILCGKTGDRANLKGTVTRLLLLREGCNYLYCAEDETMSTEAGLLSAALIGWTGIPALTAILKHALLLGWAYAESLLDVRGLMEGNKIPLLKDAGSWTLSLENLAKINEILDQGGNGQKEGFSYRGYLRLLLHMQSVSDQKKRGLDLVELRVRAGTGLSNFAVDHCIVALREQVRFTAPALFSRVTGAFLGLMGNQQTYVVSSGFTYLQ